MSNIVVLAPKPKLICMALTPTIPAPIINMFAGSAREVPEISFPFPPLLFFNSSIASKRDNLPAISLIGFNIGVSLLMTTVSYASAVTLHSRSFSVKIFDELR